MRIISGSHRGKQIFPDKSFSARPTTDFAKENIFNVLTNYIDFENCRVLDLFSGTGSISYEFASRGASKIIAVELNYKHFAFIKRTAATLGFKNMQVYKKMIYWKTEALPSLNILLPLISLHIPVSKNTGNTAVSIFPFSAKSPSVHIKKGQHPCRHCPSHSLSFI